MRSEASSRATTSAGQESLTFEACAGATELNLPTHGRPVLLASLLLLPAPLTVKIGSELDIGVKDDVVPQLWVLENLSQIQLTEGVASDGWMERRHVHSSLPASVATADPVLLGFTRLTACGGRNHVWKSAWHDTAHESRIGIASRRSRSLDRGQEVYQVGW